MTSAPTPTAKWSKPPAQINSVSISDDGSRCVYGSSYERGSGYFYTYFFDDAGNQLWKKPIVEGQVTYQGVFWVAVSGDGQFVASGGETIDTYSNPTAPTPGFLQAFKADTGTQILNLKLSARINQVSLSQDGKYLAVCYGHTIEVFILKKGIINPGEYSYEYQSIFTNTSATYGINSCVISRDGSTVVASGIAYSDGANNTAGRKQSSTTSTSGKVFSYSINDLTVTALGSSELSTGSMRVAVTDTGEYWTASLHDGSCVLFNRANPNAFEWQCTPPNPNLELAYAVDITQTDAGDVYVACGANLSGSGDGGFLYLVKSAPAVYAEQAESSPYPPTTMTGVIQWSTNIQFGVNPGVTMDKNANYVTATDGKPDGNSVVESAGSFYLYQVSTGNLVWQQPTFMMNWPMMISRDGSSVIGGSDDGSFYYWNTPGS